MEIKIKGKKSEAVISTLGAQLMSFAKDGKEYIWNGDERYWKGRSPLLFPFVGGLRNNKTIIYGKEYCGCVELEGNGKNVSIIIKPAGSSGSDDPLNQRGTIAWKVKGFGAGVLHDNYGVRLEHGVSV